MHFGMDDSLKQRLLMIDASIRSSICCQLILLKLQQDEFVIYN